MIRILKNCLLTCVSISVLLGSAPGCADTNNSLPSKDMQTLLQMTLDLKAMEQYYHIDKLPERAPLIVIRNHYINADLKLKKFGTEVVFKKKKDISDRKQAYLEITKIDILENSAVLQYVYPVEGIAGTVNFKKIGQTWQVENVKIVER